MKVFKNRHNVCHNIDGNVVWESRSCAVVAVIIMKKDNEYYALINKRGAGAAPPKFKWNNICGYMDFDETGTEAVIREVYEETGVDIDEILETKTIIVNDLEQPFYVNTSPSENRQNISLSYGLVFESDDFIETTNAYSEPNEIEDIKWINIKDISKFDFAFEHDKRIRTYLNKIKID